MGRRALERMLCGARSRWLAILIAFSPKPRSGGCSAAEGLGKKAIFTFADVSKKNLNGMRREGRNFELVDFEIPLRAVVGRRFVRPTNHYRSRVEFVFDVRTLARLVAWFFFSALRPSFARLNFSSLFVPRCSRS